MLPALLQAQPGKDQKWGVSFTPAVVPAPSINYAFQAGVEYRFTEKLSLLTEFAFVPHYSNSQRAADRKYFRIKPELRYIFHHEKQRFQEYFALQVSYAFRHFRDIDGGSYFDGNRVDTIATTFTGAIVNSPISTACIQYGVDFLAASNLYIELFTALGVRNINTKYDSVINPAIAPHYITRDKIFLVPDPAWQYNTSVYRAQFNLGVRLLYRFGNN
ncbi:MAG: DUF3575 domain-containing protein [Chitinophagaceae bacterium]